MADSRLMRLAALFVILVCTAGCDQVTKHFARTRLSQTGLVALPGSFIQFTLAENPGAFLSLGASLPERTRGALAIGLALGLMLLSIWLVRTLTLSRLCFLGLALMWAGGVSNLVDRFWRHGPVTDFMVFRAGPLHSGIFNVADFAVIIGLLLLLVSLRARHAAL